MVSVLLVQQMEKVEEDLAHSKKIRERQSKEFSRQLDDMKMKHDKMVQFVFIPFIYPLIPLFLTAFL